MISKDVDIISVCMVTQDYNSQMWLTRVADVCNGRLRKPEYEEDEPKYFDNRDRIFYRNGPNEARFIGIWHWTAIPNKNGFGSDYVTSDYLPNLIPTEIVELSGAKDVQDIISILKTGLKLKNIPYNFFACTPISEDVCTGILCRNRDFEENNGCYFLKNSISSLEKYEIPASSVYHFEDRMIYKDITIDLPYENVLVKEPNEIIKEIILNRASWSVMKNRDMTRAQWNEFKRFVSDLGNDSLHQEISKEFGCTVNEAEEYLENFMKSSEEYLKSNEIDKQTLESIVLNNNTLMQKSKLMVKESWQQENSEMIIKAEEGLQNLKNDLAAENKKLEAAQAEYETIYERVTHAQEKLDLIQEQIDTQEQIGQQVCTKVKEKISFARENAAEFIAEMIMTQLCGEQIGKDVFQVSSFSHNEELSLIQHGKEMDLETVDINENWIDTISSIAGELYEAGIADNYCDKMAAFMYAAYCNHFPLLLAGPCGEAIADAFSVAVMGKSSTKINCEDECSKVAIYQISELQDLVVTIKNPFQGSWVECLSETFMTGKNFYLITCPYAEDLVIEPVGLYNYMFPVLTELFVDKHPSKDYIGGICSEHYEEYVTVDYPEKRHASIVRKLKMRKLFSNKMQQLLADYHTILNNEDIDDDYLFVLLPYAYCTGASDLLKEIVDGQKGISKISSELILEYMGIDQ